MPRALCGLPGLNRACQEAPKHWAVTVNSDWQHVISLLSASPNSGPCSTLYPILYIPNTSRASQLKRGRLCKNGVSNSWTQTNIIIFSLSSPADVCLFMWPSAAKGTHGHVHLLGEKMLTQKPADTGRVINWWVFFVFFHGYLHKFQRKFRLKKNFKPVSTLKRWRCTKQHSKAAKCPPEDYPHTPNPPARTVGSAAALPQPVSF